MPHRRRRHRVVGGMEACALMEAVDQPPYAVRNNGHTGLKASRCRVLKRCVLGRAQIGLDSRTLRAIPRRVPPQARPGQAMVAVGSVAFLKDPHAHTR